MDVVAKRDYKERCYWEIELWYGVQNLKNVRVLRLGKVRFSYKDSVSVFGQFFSFSKQFSSVSLTKVPKYISIQLLTLLKIK